MYKQTLFNSLDADCTIVALETFYNADFLAGHE
jgi:hypothetical protein